MGVGRAGQVGLGEVDEALVVEGTPEPLEAPEPGSEDRLGGDHRASPGLGHGPPRSAGSRANGSGSPMGNGTWSVPMSFPASRPATEAEERDRDAGPRSQLLDGLAACGEQRPHAARDQAQDDVVDAAPVPLAPRAWRWPGPLRWSPAGVSVRRVR